MLLLSLASGILPEEGKIILHLPLRLGDVSRVQVPALGIVADPIGKMPTGTAAVRR